MSENEDIKKANEELEKISADKHEQYLVHLRQKHIMDTKAVEEYGYLRGKEEGEKEKLIEMVKAMIEKGLTIEMIADISKLSVEEIEKLAKESGIKKINN